MGSVPHYDRITVWLHWLTVTLVVVLWILGETADWFPNRSVANTGLWSMHVVLGFALALVLIYRISWRATSGVSLPPADRGLWRAAAKGVHHLLYVLLGIAVILGIVNAFVRGYSMFALFHLPQLGNPAWRRPITRFHDLAANAIMVVALLHAAAALFHHYVLRDRLISRMALD